MKRAILIFILVLVMSCITLANITDFFRSIPKPIRVAIGVGIGLYAASWAYSWIFEPIILVAQNPYGAFNFGPFIVIDHYIWNQYDEEDRNYVLNHEYTHYVQHALFGPIVSLTYPVFSLYSIIKTGNQWDANFWEVQASESGDSKPDWQPSFVIKF